MLGQFKNGDIVVADFEAGLGTLSRIEPHDVDVLLLVAEPTKKSVEVTKRGLGMIREAKLAKTIVVANRIRTPQDQVMMKESFPDDQVVTVPEDSAIRAADSKRSRSVRF